MDNPVPDPVEEETISKSKKIPISGRIGLQNPDPVQHWSPGSLRDLITTTVNLNRKLVYLSSQKKLKFLKDAHISSKAFFHFPNVRMRTNVFCEEAFANDKVEEY